jgi:hypothetical protein
MFTIVGKLNFDRFCYTNAANSLSEVGKPIATSYLVEEDTHDEEKTVE